jgi:RluA family pseudouridine synthase
MKPARGGLRESGARRTAAVSRREAGLRLDLFLAGAFAGLSRKQAKHLVDNRRVSVDGRIESMASRILRGGERVEVILPERRERPAPPGIAVLYEDEQCLAIRKPPGLASGPTRDPGRVHAARLAEELSGRPLTLLHRIDKHTSGVLLLAKTGEFAGALTRAFRERTVRKTYLALVRGSPPGVFEVVSHLREGEGGRMRSVRSGGARAETRFFTLAHRGGHALLEACPRTGRTHQIRVQLAHSGYPILGDSLYGGEASVKGYPVPRQMLHAWSLAFLHPGLGREVRVQDPPPEDFLEIARAIFGAKLPPALARGTL